MQRPAFWRVPHNRPDPDENRFRRVQANSCVQGQLQPGDQITKIDSYDARDLRHEDAQRLFRDAQDTVKLAIRRDAAHTPHQNQNAAPYSPRPTSAGAATFPAQSLSNGSSSRCSSSQLGALSPAPATQNSYSPVYTPYRPVSPARPQSTNLSFSPGHPSCPLLPPDYRSHEIRRYRDTEQELECVVNQPYRTTPLVLPGAKVKRDTNVNDCYLRHHPNPAVRASPHSTLDYQDFIMKQKVADSILHRVAGEDIANKVVHKQFNSPIGLYSDANIADTIRQVHYPRGN